MSTEPTAPAPPPTTPPPTEPDQLTQIVMFTPQPGTTTRRGYLFALDAKGAVWIFDAENKLFRFITDGKQSQWPVIPEQATATVQRCGFCGSDVATRASGQPL